VAWRGGAASGLRWTPPTGYLPRVGSTIEAAGVALAYTDHGAGSPAVVVIHGLASCRAAWEGFARDLADTSRVIAYDRRGYGGSEEPEPYGATTVEEQAEDAAALINGLDAAPAVLVGDGFGALVALDLLRRHRHLVAGVALLEPPLFAFVPAAAEELSAQRLLLEEALRDHGPEGAVEAWLADRAAQEDVMRARQAHRAFFADFAGLTSWSVTRRELRAMDAPADVVTAPGTPPHVAAAADALADLLPRAARTREGDAAAAVRRLLGRG
jgi:pimeloyl-ACP methyl ester carboxylesterase